MTSDPSRNKRKLWNLVAFAARDESTNHRGWGARFRIVAPLCTLGGKYRFVLIFDWLQLYLDRVRAAPHQLCRNLQNNWDVFTRTLCSCSLFTGLSCERSSDCKMWFSMPLLQELLYSSHLSHRTTWRQLLHVERRKVGSNFEGSAGMFVWRRRLPTTFCGTVHKLLVFGNAWTEI